MEEWRAVVGYEGLYEVSNFGNIKRTKQSCGAISGRILKQKITHRGYKRICLSCNGIKKDFYTHVLIAQAFIGYCAKYEVNHKDGTKINNHLSNLEVVSHQENVLHSRTILGKCGASGIGRSNTNAKLTDDIAMQAKNLRRKGFSFTKIASLLMISKGCAWSAVIGWKHLQPNT